MGIVKQTFMERFKQYPAHTNLALYYYKLAPNFGDLGKEAKTNFLKTFVDKKYNAALVTRRIEAIKSISTPKVLRLKTTSRFLCGTGYTSPIEWGFNFDWTTGAPLLPGSSFKGALLSYLEFIAQEPVEKWNSDQSVQLLDEPNTIWTKDDVLEVFGPQGNKGDSHIGGVIFYDVYPSDGNDKPFEVDVITPHYKDYYDGKKRNGVLVVPDDTENPVPLHFLTVKPGVTFNFCYKIQPFIGAKCIKNDAVWKSRMDELIIECSRNYGFGAKTSSGYGYFEPV